MVGSWPGPSFGTNDFVRIYADALVRAGCRIVDVVNPMRLKERVDVLHMHWPEQLIWQGGSQALQALRIVRASRAIARMRRRGTRLVWMMHNIRPHDLNRAQALLWRLIERLVLRQVDGLMTLSPATLPIAQAAHPALARRPAVAVHHPAFPATGTPARSAARTLLNVDQAATVVATIGFLRPYKGLEELITCFRAVADPTKRLVLAGRCTPGYAAVLGDLVDGDKRIRLEARALDDDELLAFTAAADWIVLPFRDYLHSGSMVHALSLDRPVLTPRAPFAIELARIAGADAVRMYDGRLTPAIIADLVPSSIAPDLHPMQPSTVGRNAAAFYARLGAAA